MENLKPSEKIGDSLINKLGKAILHDFKLSSLIDPFDASLENEEIKKDSLHFPKSTLEPLNRTVQVESKELENMIELTDEKFIFKTRVTIAEPIDEITGLKKKGSFKEKFSRFSIRKKKEAE